MVLPGLIWHSRKACVLKTIQRNIKGHAAKTCNIACASYCLGTRMDFTPAPCRAPPQFHFFFHILVNVVCWEWAGSVKKMYVLAAVWFEKDLHNKKLFLYKKTALFLIKFSDCTVCICLCFFPQSLPVASCQLYTAFFQGAMFFSNLYQMVQ